MHEFAAERVRSRLDAASASVQPKLHGDLGVYCHAYAVAESNAYSERDSVADAFSFSVPNADYERNSESVAFSFAFRFAVSLA